MVFVNRHKVYYEDQAVKILEHLIDVVSDNVYVSSNNDVLLNCISVEASMTKYYGVYPSIKL